MIGRRREPSQVYPSPAVWFYRKKNPKNGALRRKLLGNEEKLGNNTRSFVLIAPFSSQTFLELTSGIYDSVRPCGNPWANRTPRRSPSWILRPPHLSLRLEDQPRSIARPGLPPVKPSCRAFPPSRRHCLRSCSKKACCPPTRSGSPKSTAKSTIATCGSRSSSSI